LTKKFQVKQLKLLVTNHHPQVWQTNNASTKLQNIHESSMWR